MARPWQCFSNSKPKTAFKLKFFSDSKNIKHCKKRKKKSVAPARRLTRECTFFFSIQLLGSQAACLKLRVRAHDAACGLAYDAARKLERTQELNEKKICPELSSSLPEALGVLLTKTVYC